MTRYIILFFFVLIPLWSFGQGKNLSELIVSIAEELAADNTDPEAVNIFVERLHELVENPVKINSPDEDEVSRLFFLSDFQVKALTDYSHTTGQIVSVYELANIPGIDKESVEMIIPFITLEYKLINNSDSAHWRNFLISNFSLKSANNDKSSLGSDWRILTKYHFASGSFGGGFTMEKDPGEKALSGNPPLPDFFSAHLCYGGRGIIRRIIVGDYSARFGEGTNINTGIRRGIALTSPGYMSGRDDIKPYTSTEENRFFRGVAVELSVRKVELSMFFSKNYADATVATDSEKDYIENFYQSGVHNTPALLNKKDAISEMAYGVSLTYNLNNLKIGFLWSENRISLPVNVTFNDPEKIFDFSGDRNNLYTVYYNSLIRKILLYGEFSSNDKSKYAIIQGVAFRPSDRLTINFLFRNYNPGYSTFFGQGPGTGSKTTNEKGILGNFTFEAARHLFISGGCDVQHFPWLKYRCSAPSLGVRQELKVRFLPSEKLALDAFYSYRLSMTDYAQTQGIPAQLKDITRSIKIAAHYSVYNNLTLGTRIDYKIAEPQRSSGFILLQEINYSFRRIPVTFWARYCLFNTDDWASRIYTYENDLFYNYCIPALYGEGSRSYLMAEWKIGDFAVLRCKYGITSQNTALNSVHNTEEIKIQFKIWF